MILCINSVLFPLFYLDFFIIEIKKNILIVIQQPVFIKYDQIIPFTEKFKRYLNLQGSQTVNLDESCGCGLRDILIYRALKHFLQDMHHILRLRDILIYRALKPTNHGHP